MRRTNDQWMADLSAQGAKQAAALNDLRDALVGGLRRALSDRPRADDAFIEDTVQDTLVRVLDRLTQFEGRSRFLTWATAIAIRVAMTELRRHRWKDVSLDQVVAHAGLPTPQVPSPEDGPATQWERRSVIDAMHGVIENELTPKQRAALLAELKGMPQDEIARQLGSNRNAVYKLTHDARKRLKEGLESAGYVASDIQSAFAM